MQNYTTALMWTLREASAIGPSDEWHAECTSSADKMEDALIKPLRESSTRTSAKTTNNTELGTLLAFMLKSAREAFEEDSLRKLYGFRFVALLAAPESEDLGIFEGSPLEGFKNFYLHESNPPFTGGEGGVDRATILVVLLKDGTTWHTLYWQAKTKSEESFSKGFIEFEDKKAFENAADKIAAKAKDAKKAINKLWERVFGAPK